MYIRLFTLKYRVTVLGLLYQQGSLKKKYIKMNIKCEDCSNKIYTPRYCLQCHNPYCIGCQRVHSQRYSNHFFELPTFDFSKTICEIHYHERFISYCCNCNVMLCIDCVKLSLSHNTHNVINLCEVKNEQKKVAAKEQLGIRAILKATRYEIDKREIKFRQFKKQLTDIVDRFPYGSRYSLGKQEMIGRMILNWHAIETHPPLELDILFKQIKQLRAAQYVYEEIQNAQTKLMSIYGDEQFISLFIQYQNAVEIYTNTPAKCEEDPDLEIWSEQTSDVDTKNPYFTIHIV